MNGPVFIVGHPRSGTTLTQLLLTATGEIGSAPETHFFTYVMEPYASAIPLEFLGHGKRGPIDPNPLVQIVKRLAAKPRIQLTADERSALGSGVRDDPDDPRLVLDTLMRLLTVRAGPSDRWLEKTPRHFYFVGEILDLFPDCSVVHVVRDPRDVVSSPEKFRRLAQGPERAQLVRELSHSWSRAATRARAAVADSRCVVMRYEDLARDPVAELGRVYEFLGLASDPNHAVATFSSGYEAAVVPGEDVRKGLLADGALRDRRGVWLERMSEEESETVVSIDRPLMEEFGYDI